MYLLQWFLLLRSFAQCCCCGWWVGLSRCHAVTRVVVLSGRACSALVPRARFVQHRDFWCDALQRPQGDDEDDDADADDDGE